MDEVIKDSRFSHILRDAKFRRLPKKHVKVKIDQRFQSMFHDEKFLSKCKLDKRGRSDDLSRSDDLKRLYELSGNEEDDTESIEGSANSPDPEIENKSHAKVIGTNEIRVSEKEKKLLTSEIKRRLKDMTTDYARGEGVLMSESSSYEESASGDESDDRELDHCWGELDKDAERTDVTTSRLAVCNLDWDRIDATDLMVLFNSFVPKGGLIKSIIIYPSDFGIQRMKDEEENGPAELVDDTLEEEDKGKCEVQMEKIRKYQLNRLKYYYAVVVCNSSDTADVLYKECDGLDYECSSSKLDLRFIPDDVIFDQKPKDICCSVPDLGTYKPKYFVTSALTKAKVDLTWDETDVNRQELVKSIHSGNFDENSIRKYIACSSSSSESGGECNNSEENFSPEADNSGSDRLNSMEKYKALLADVQASEQSNKKNSVNMEVTWNLDLEKKARHLIKESSVSKDGKSQFQKYLDKKKEKKKIKKNEKHFSKGGDSVSEIAFSDDELPSDVDLNDPYFKEELKGTKRVKRSEKSNEEDDDLKRVKQQAELELLTMDTDSSLQHFNLKKIRENERVVEGRKLRKYKKRKASKEGFDESVDGFKVDVNDERFSALYTSKYFNIDPADPQFRATKGTKQLIEEKLRRRQKEEIENCSTDSRSGSGGQSIDSDNDHMKQLIRNVKKRAVPFRKT